MRLKCLGKIWETMTEASSFQTCQVENTAWYPNYSIFWGHSWPHSVTDGFVGLGQLNSLSNILENIHWRPLQHTHVHSKFGRIYYRSKGIQSDFPVGTSRFHWCGTYVSRGFIRSQHIFTFNDIIHLILSISRISRWKEQSCCFIFRNKYSQLHSPLSPISEGTPIDHHMCRFMPKMLIHFMVSLFLWLKYECSS